MILHESRSLESDRGGGVASLPVRTRSLAWTLPLAAVLLAVYFVVDSWNRRGPTILVHVAEGHGIRAGDDLSYRGIAVGEVEAVELGPELEGVLLRVRLDRSAEALARAGSRRPSPGSTSSGWSAGRASAIACG